MKKVIFFVTICFSFLNQLSAQSQTSASNLYKGTVDGKTPITVYIKIEENPCTADLMYTSMYRQNKSKNWIQLNVTQNRKKENEFVLVEQGFSGVLILQKSGDSFTGLWISPDAKKQLKVDLKEASMTKKELENFEKTMEKVNYENNDC
ncbi:hypothetical protein [Flavobacterium nitrogenifigens]|uniref:Uncharacterized protein n=1 Tax=Flavobacterium nitrogenifigens TaxID=1617283 RepID=A0A521ETR9_9FLAO|nr:hypothetical protein [Flavobacterium nitrogenifigens]KAF2333422.1 hypothetical protein DM397_09800 [Flavobacterium nitrogenifigens]SMO87319.1 hypothetical protein SAMN06265220_10591 [Flavobacterium nitrogenifigens]